MLVSSKPFVSIILVNYNSSDYTLPCIQSIRDKTIGVDYEIVVVDNASTLAERDKLRDVREDPKITFVQSSVNLGFSGGNILGVQAARLDADYYFLLNNDTILLNNVCGELAQYMEDNPETGVCTPQTFKADGSFEPSFTYFPTLGVKLFGHGLMRKLYPSGYPSFKKRYIQPLPVPVVTGCAMFVRGKVFRQLGGLDTTYFLYCEEEDLCQRMKRAGHAAALVPSAEFVHYAGGSGAQSLPVRKEFYISLFHYYRTYHNWLDRKLLQLFFAIKNGRKTFKNRDFGRVAWFILRGAPMSESLRYRQGLGN
jgi:GT2 family glycosyltransferase